MFDLSKQRTDEKAEVDGVWEDLGSGAKIKIARLGNPKYNRRLKALLKPHKRAIRADSLEPKIMDDAIYTALSETVIIDWKGIAVDGKEIKFSKANALKLLREEKYFRDLVSDCSQDASLFKLHEQEEGSKNS